jgi:hypothetical protein
MKINGSSVWRHIVEEIVSDVSEECDFPIYADEGISAFLRNVGANLLDMAYTHLRKQTYVITLFCF